MADFSLSFKKGIEAARIAENNRQEIRSVLKAVNDALSLETEGKVALRIQVIRPKTGNIVIDFLQNPLPSRTILEAHNPQALGGPVWELCEWSEDPNGYPCKIQRDRTEFVCEDKEALESALQNLLEDPGVGRRLYNLMHIEDKGQGSQESSRAQERPAVNE